MPINGIGGFSQLPIQLPVVSRTPDQANTNNSLVNGELDRSPSTLNANPASNHTTTEIASTQVVPANREATATQLQSTANQQNRQSQALIPADRPNNNIAITEQQQQLLQRFQQSSLPVDNTSRLIDERV
ncbi:hypothetical protein H0A36_02415 [Endozoicomonas sp. SM1973]|uniref:Uncharacterized protein n=1 Tax=Spartinivicinus marinus TaxID=2994442 RepID=A0A853HU92_9GAMM|nr:hypothetical protein [Spartinivicinus marinus]MCX4029913.1 hypothetical protein [Spartinivicinus marinus]NYZ64843.1 hypothetical protein [Spartinivicinus marinus]